MLPWWFNWIQTVAAAMSLGDCGKVQKQQTTKRTKPKQRKGNKESNYLTCASAVDTTKELDLHSHRPLATAHAEILTLSHLHCVRCEMVFPSLLENRNVHRNAFKLSQLEQDTNELRYESQGRSEAPSLLTSSAQVFAGRELPRGDGNSNFTTSLKNRGAMRLLFSRPETFKISFRCVNDPT